jgi:hypothetical protein
MRSLRTEFGSRVFNREDAAAKTEVILTPSSAAEVRARIMRDTREEVEAEIRY